MTSVLLSTNKKVKEIPQKLIFWLFWIFFPATLITNEFVF